MVKKWAQIYRGSGRFTGHRAEEPVYTNTGEVAPDWIFIGDMTDEEFWSEFEDSVPSK